jgi:hypothetical protein
MKKYILFWCGFAIFFAALSFKSFGQNMEGIKIKIADFTVLEDNNKISINWKTAPKMEANYFEVEKSNDGKNFKTVAYVLGADPTKINCDCYSCFDKITIDKRESFYRIKHIDTKGGIEFSETKIPDIKK